MAMLDDFKTFLNKPFSADMTALGWLMFVGLLICINILWGLVLKHLFME
jgi:hypothetical protein